MRNIFMLATANIRKSKSQGISLLLFVMIAAMFLNVGLIMYFGFGNFFDERAEQLNTPHFLTVQPNAITTDEQLRYLEDYPNVTEVETQETIANSGEYFVNGLKNEGHLTFSRMEETQHMNPPSLIGDFLPLTDNTIYIPYFIMLDGKYKVGDDFKLNLMGIELQFIVGGGTEEIMLGSIFNYIYRFYISDEMFAEIKSKFADSLCTILSVRMNESDKSLQLDVDYIKEFFYGEDIENSSDEIPGHMTYDYVKTARTMIPMISSLLVVAFAIILLIVSLIVIRFRITNSIEEDMVNIGAIKAVGYRSRQIIASIVLQFGSIATIGSILGIALSQILIPIVTKLLESQIALVWNSSFDMIKAFMSLVVVVLTVISVSFFSSRCIKKLHPLTALRSGITTHNFKHNMVSLDKSYGSLTLLLAVKQIIQNKKQTITITVIISAVTFVSVMGIALHYNVNVKRDAFARTVAGEIPEAYFIQKDNSDSALLRQYLLDRSDVRKAFGFQTGVSLLVDEIDVSTTVVEDCALLEGSLLVSGRHPKHGNEIALGAATARLIGKNIGDMVMVKSGSNEKEYMVTGIIQNMNNYGVNAVITSKGMLEIQPDFMFYCIYVYLTANTDIQVFIEDVKVAQGDIFRSIINMQDQIAAQFESMGNIFAAIAVGILGITVIVVVLVLYMVIKANIIRRKRELGIQKALGFTTLQLINQIALHYSPIIILGVILGTFGGYFCLNPLFIALTSSMGIVKAELISPLNWTISTGVALILLAYIVVMLVAWRIRKISAYSLISE